MYNTHRSKSEGRKTNSFIYQFSMHVYLATKAGIPAVEKDA
jgi:hypothetical protein